MKSELIPNVVVVVVVLRCWDNREWTDGIQLSVPFCCQVPRDSEDTDR
jgi:hypothetical protein